MQIKKALINDRLHVLKVSWKVWNPIIYNFAIIYVAYFFTVSIVFFVYKQNITAQKLKKLEQLWMEKFSVFLLCWSIYLLFFLYIHIYIYNICTRACVCVFWWLTQQGLYLEALSLLSAVLAEDATWRGFFSCFSPNLGVNRRGTRILSAVDGWAG